MGMYTKINLISRLKKETPKEEVTKLIKENMLHCSSYYFTGTENTNYIEDENVLHIDCDVKNYYGQLDNVIKFLEKYSSENYNWFLGYSRYEEANNPTLYFINKGKITEFNNNNVEEEKYW